MHENNRKSAAAMKENISTGKSGIAAYQQKMKKGERIKKKTQK